MKNTQSLIGKNDLVVVTGGGGFIGGHLVADLRAKGYRRIRSVDIKPRDEWFQEFPDVENLQLDLKELGAARRAATDAAYVFNLAADMGGMGFIETHKAECMLSVLINTHMLMAAQGRWREALLLLVLGLRVRGRQADVRRGGRVEGGGRLPRHAGGRLRLGEALQRTHVPALHARISGSPRVWRATTTSTALSARTTADARRHRRQSAVR